MDPLHDQNRNGLEFTEFSKFVGGTFSEWWVDCELVEQLFNMADVDRDGSIDFVELVVLLSGLSFLFPLLPFIFRLSFRPSFRSSFRSSYFIYFLHILSVICRGTEREINNCKYSKLVNNDDIYCYIQSHSAYLS